MIDGPDAGDAARGGSLDTLLRGDPFEATFEAAGVGLAIVDLTGRFVRVNDAFARMHATEPEDLIGESFRAQDRLTVLLDDVAQRSTRYEEEIREEVWLSLGVSLRSDPEGQPAWFVIDAEDVSRRRLAERELEHRALHDDLTGLPNRMLVHDRITTALARSKRGAGSVGVAFCDLDGFKEINDKHGHLLGDVVLRVVAARLLAAVRPSDTVGRLGGDEFVVVIGPPVSPEDLAQLVERLTVALSAPLRERGTQTSVGVSIGTAMSDVDCRDDAESMLARADLVMYDVKRGRRLAGKGTETDPHEPTDGPDAGALEDPLEHSAQEPLEDSAQGDRGSGT